MNLSDCLNYFVALLTIANPFSALPIALRITRQQTKDEKKRIAFVAMCAIATIFLIATWIGAPLLDLLGIQLPAFQVAGSFVLLLLAFSMLNASESTIKQNPEEQKEKLNGEASAIVPLAIPIIAGPGAISTIISRVSHYPGPKNQLIFSLVSVLVTLVLGAVIYFSHNLEKLIGQQGINIFNRISGLLLAAIAIQMFTSGAVVLEANTRKMELEEPHAHIQAQKEWAPNDSWVDNAPSHEPSPRSG